MDIYTTLRYRVISSGNTFVNIHLLLRKINTLFSLSILCQSINYRKVNCIFGCTCFVCVLCVCFVCVCVCVVCVVCVCMVCVCVCGVCVVCVLCVCVCVVYVVCLCVVCVVCVCVCVVCVLCVLCLCMCVVCVCVLCVRKRERESDGEERQIFLKFFRKTR